MTEIILPTLVEVRQLLIALGYTKQSAGNLVLQEAAIKRFAVEIAGRARAGAGFVRLITDIELSRVIAVDKIEKDAASLNAPVVEAAKEIPLPRQMRDLTRRLAKAEKHIEDQSSAPAAVRDLAKRLTALEKSIERGLRQAHQLNQRLAGVALRTLELGLAGDEKLAVELGLAKSPERVRALRKDVLGLRVLLAPAGIATPEVAPQAPVAAVPLLGIHETSSFDKLPVLAAAAPQPVHVPATVPPPKHCSEDAAASAKLVGPRPE